MQAVQHFFIGHILVAILVLSMQLFFLLLFLPCLRLVSVRNEIPLVKSFNRGRVTVGARMVYHGVEFGEAAHLGVVQA